MVVDKSVMSSLKTYIPRSNRIFYYSLYIQSWILYLEAYVLIFWQTIEENPDPEETLASYLRNKRILYNNVHVLQEGCIDRSCH